MLPFTWLTLEPSTPTDGLSDRFIMHIKSTTLLGNCKDMKGSVGSRCAQINHVAHQEDIEQAYKVNIDLTEDVITYKLKNPVYLIFFFSINKILTGSPGCHWIYHPPSWPSSILTLMPAAATPCRGNAFFFNLRFWKLVSYQWTLLRKFHEHIAFDPQRGGSMLCT